MAVCRPSEELGGITGGAVTARGGRVVVVAATDALALLGADITPGDISPVGAFDPGPRGWSEISPVQIQIRGAEVSHEALPVGVGVCGASGVIVVATNEGETIWVR